MADCSPNCSSNHSLNNSPDYSRMPTLVLNEIFGYLSMKERIRCKAVCRAWKMEIELKEKARDTLVLHLGPYLRNARWKHTNNGGLMKFENSFQVKRLNFLQHPRTRTLLKQIKKLAIVNYHLGIMDSEILQTNVHPYIRHFDQCEEIEIREFNLQDTLTFELPKLRALVIRDCPGAKLVVNCPSLELLFWNTPIQEVSFRNIKKLKSLFCCGLRVSPNVKFPNLAYLNFYTGSHDLMVADGLLGQMPKLKRFVLNSHNLQADLKNIRAQQERYGRPNLEVLCSGFSVPVRFALGEISSYVKLELCTGELFENYSKLVENWPWKFWIDYSRLFDKFKILPSDFFERFSESYGIEISAVTNYTHLFEFLRCYPFVTQLKIHWSSVKANRILDLVHLLNPSLRELTIVEVSYSLVPDIDLFFMRMFDLVLLTLISTRLPTDFIRKLATNRGPRFYTFKFIEHKAYINRQAVIYFFPGEYAYGEYAFVDFTCASGLARFTSIEQLIAAMRAHPLLGSVMYGE